MLTKTEIEYYKQYYNQLEKNFNYVQTPKYLKWLYNEVLSHKRIDDNPYRKQLYNTECNNQRNFLSDFISYVDSKAKQQSIEMSLNTNCMFEDIAYNIKLFDKYFHIIQICGDGTTTIVTLLNDKPERVVVIN